MSELQLGSTILVISDFVQNAVEPGRASYDHIATSDKGRNSPPLIYGSYLERLPLAAVHTGMVQFSQIWHHAAGPGGSNEGDDAHLTRRIFPLGDCAAAPFHSGAMLNFIHLHGAPKILCVWGLGLSEAILEACRDSFIIYNSIDAPALRVSEEISRHFDLVLTGAQWQSDAVEARQPNLATAIMTIGPEFAPPETSYPIGEKKLYDVIYVAAAQAYKRHDVLFAAMARSSRPIGALYVMSYGEDAAALREKAATQGLDVTFVGPPDVPYAEVNRMMNQARVGVDDGAPAILTEYMLAGLPVVANAELACGLQYIQPDTGLIASADSFELVLIEALDHPERFAARQALVEHACGAIQSRNWSNCSRPGVSRLAVAAYTPKEGRFEPSAST